MVGLFHNREERENNYKNVFLSNLIRKTNCCGENEEFVNKEEKKKCFEVLFSLGVPINEIIISLVLKEICILIWEHPKRGIN
mmetsp:Transcript_14774/g.21104  ORF Transcript_14774/g.21104 Transcript_14774/m.21104 type:complete len:82 (-) Transcript_14774:417-662(-)